MSVIAIFSGAHCRSIPVIDGVKTKTGYRIVTEQEIIAKAAASTGMPEKKFEAVFASKISVFNQFTHERERSIAYLRRTLAGILSDDNLIVTGFPLHLIPKEIAHILRVCLIADLKSRLATAREEKGLSEKAALESIRKEDEKTIAWVKALHDEADPWNPKHYDLVLPTDKTSVTDAVAAIVEHGTSDILRRSALSEKALGDFALTAEIETALAREGHNIRVASQNGAVRLTIEKQVLMLSRLEEELKQIVSKIPGVRSIATEVGKNFHQTDIYRKYDFQTPSKVLLVDDEREFVQTLSERLIMRDMGSAVAYDGESALTMIHDDEPEVMILDLKMPGINGIEVLRQVKETRPEIEVIILTGHGSEADKQICLQLGAFAYLQKPVDINTLSTAIQQANEKILKNKPRTAE
ncbi:MAG: response regulator [Thermodesulfobacteriota bacterium]